VRIAGQLACPRDLLPVTQRQQHIACANGHRYPIVNDIPVMLIREVAPTHPYFDKTLDLQVRLARTVKPATLDPEMDAPAASAPVDSFVQGEVVRSCGNLYRGVRGHLSRYPIPELPLARSSGGRLLDIGCNWGRWSIAAARKGYHVVGLDPSLEALLAAQRVAAQLGVEAAFVVGDCRFLPFRDDSFDVTFSYSVLQHLDKLAVRKTLVEASRVTTRSGRISIQMANSFGTKQLLNRLRQLLTADRGQFRIRHWTPAELKAVFEANIGPTTLTSDGFFSLNPQVSDLDLLSRSGRAVIQVSEELKRQSKRAKWLTHFADSLMVSAANDKAYRIA